MSNQKAFLHDHSVITGLDPVADALAGTVTSDVINASHAHAVTFIIHKGVGATGTSTITVEACDDVVPTNTSAIPFMYQACTATGTSDIFAAFTRATSTGFLTTAGSGQIYVISVDCDQLANSGYKFVRLKAVESVDSPVLCGILAILHPMADQRRVQVTQIA